MKPVMRTLGKDHEDGTGGSLGEQQEGLLDIQVVYESGAWEMVAPESPIWDSLAEVEGKTKGTQYI